MSKQDKPNSIAYAGDCLEILDSMERESADLVYLDPPFFTQRVHKAVTRDGSATFSFRDVWTDEDVYAGFLRKRIACARDILRDSGSLFFHCDTSGSHIARILLDNVFGSDQFRSEIIWSFRRWSNVKKGLLSSHQNILFYSKSDDFKFNTIYREYSPATNVDQIMQRRSRDSRNKAVYARDENGIILANGTKRGVPLSDVWEIPFLNPKARERIGFPTQKPVLLLKQIIELVTDEGDLVVDPFCGSGTTLVAAQLLNRNSIGIDISKEAVELTRKRLKGCVVTESHLLQKGRESYRQHSSDAANHLFGVEYIPIQRNRGIDGLLNGAIDGTPVFVRVQREWESIGESAAALKKAASKKGKCRLIVIATRKGLLDFEEFSDVEILASTAFSINEYINSVHSK